MKLKTLWFTGGIILLIILIVFIGWVLFLRTQEKSIIEVFQGRGFGNAIPTFTGGEIGSTNRNIRGRFLEDFGFVPAPSENKEEVKTPRLWNISNVPAAGMVIIGTSSPFEFRFVERPSGHVFSANSHTGSVTRLSNTLIPKTREVFWGADGQLFLRHVSDDHHIATFSARIETATTSGGTGSLVGQYLEQDIVSMAVSPSTQEVFSLIETANGTIGVLSQADGSSEQLFGSFLNGWRSTRIGDVILIVQKAAQGIVGSAFTIARNGKEEVLVRNIQGLTTTVNDNNTAHLYGQSLQGAVDLFAQKRGEEVKELPLKTFADKCVFDPAREFIAYCAVPNELPNVPLPDAWYRGEVHFSDSWWKVDVERASVEHIFSPHSEFNVTLDIRDPQISPDGSYIAFIDARTQTPWAFRIQK